jgi:hypothetical protein
MLRSQEFKIKTMKRKLDDAKDELGHIREMAPREPALARQNIDMLNRDVTALEHDIRMFKHELNNPDDEI